MMLNEHGVGMWAKTAVGLAGLAAGLAAAGGAPSKPCVIAGRESPPSVCAAHAKSVAATCFICHGPDGKSLGAIPSLAGQDKTYLITAMQEFRNGKRESTVMRKYAVGYTDTEYEALAEFFSAIK